MMVTRLTVTLEGALLEDIERTAVAEDRSRSNMIRVLLREALQVRAHGERTPLSAPSAERSAEPEGGRQPE